MQALAPFVPLLRFNRESGNRTGLQSPKRDRFAGLLAIAVAAVLKPFQSGIDLAYQLALPITGMQLNCPVGLGGSAVSEIGVILIFILQVQQGLLHLYEDIGFPREQLYAEVVPLTFVHERLVVGRSVFYCLVSVLSVRRHHSSRARALPGAFYIDQPAEAITEWFLVAGSDSHMSVQHEPRPGNRPQGASRAPHAPRQVNPLAHRRLDGSRNRARSLDVSGRR